MVDSLYKESTSSALQCANLVFLQGSGVGTDTVINLRYGTLHFRQTQGNLEFGSVSSQRKL
jgi:hypothetical protein